MTTHKYRTVILQKTPSGRHKPDIIPNDQISNIADTVCINETVDTSFLPAVELPISNIIISLSEPILNYILIISTSKQKLKIEQVGYKEVYAKTFESRRRLGVSTLCEYLFKKISHCKTAEYRTKLTYQCHVTVNLEWLISVVETEMDYHIGKRMCGKKINEMYMTEYTSTQISGFGPKFYDPDKMVSKSILAQIYPMNCK